MPLFLIPWLWRGLGVLAVGLVIAGLWWKAEHWCNQACASKEKEIVGLTASIAKTQERATALALLWSGQVDKTENAAHIAETSRNEKFRELADRAKSIGASGVSHFGGVAIGLFDSARSAASGTATGPAAVTPEAAPAPASSAEEFVVSLYEWAAVCRARVDEWASFYHSLQAAVPQ